MSQKNFFMLKRLASLLVVFGLSYPLIVFVDAGIDATLNPGEVSKIFIGLGCLALLNLGYEIADFLQDEADNADNEDV